MKNPLENFRSHDADRFHTFYEKGPPSQCWEWQGVLNTPKKRTAQRYGVFKVGKVRGTRSKIHVAAHRVAYALAFGSFDYTLHVLHHCDNPRCVNPGHLFIGTNQDNIDDKVRKGRSPGSRPLAALR